MPTSPSRRPAAPLRVGVIGVGAIGSVVIDALAAGEVPGAIVSGVASRRSPATGAEHRVGVGVAELIAVSDVIVEAAGHGALHEHGVAVLAAGVDLVAVSAGALADARWRAAIAAAGPGRFRLCAGAIGGLDLLRAARRLGAFAHLTLTTSKLPPVLVQPWMDDELADRLRTGTERLVLFDGSAAGAAERFPTSVNVAATLAHELDAWDELTVRVVADPDATRTTHEIEAVNAAGDYRFEIRNRPDQANPRTSAVVAHSVLVTLAALAARS